MEGLLWRKEEGGTWVRDFVWRNIRVSDDK
jgi:hypothetical protein